MNLNALNAYSLKSSTIALLVKMQKTTPKSKKNRERKLNNKMSS
jgi:hypothetical protein